MNTRYKLIAAFAVLALLVLSSAFVGLRGAAQAHEGFKNYVDGAAYRISLANRVVDATNARAVAARNLIFATDPAQQAVEKEAVATAHNRQHEYLRKLEESAATSANPKVVELVGEIAKVEALYSPVALDIVGKASSGQRDAAISKLNAECRPLLARLLEASEAYLEYSRHRAIEEVEKAGDDYAATRTQLVVMLCLAFGGALTMSLLIPRSLMLSLGAEPSELSQAARRIAEGDLSPVLGTAGAPAGSVLLSMAAMRDSLAKVVAQVRISSENFASVSGQIAQGNQDLSGRTEQQASALQQTAASMEQLGSTVRQNADNARQADQLARGAAEVAKRGGQAVAEVVQTMAGINDSSRRIADITSVIDGIAFQTNILALNAAVEAARAGEQGRGFAVVAGEVRSLAQRSAEAAREIKALISQSVERVEQGSSLVNRAGTTMDEVVTSISRVSNIVGEISVASAEQSNGVGQVGSAVTQMDQSTQQNAALVEESAAAAQGLRAQAQQLVQVVSVFRNVPLAA